MLNTWVKAYRKIEKNTSLWFNDDCYICFSKLWYIVDRDGSYESGLRPLNKRLTIWGINRFRTALKDLEKMGLIKTQKSTTGTKITVINYKRLQSGSAVDTPSIKTNIQSGSEIDTQVGLKQIQSGSAVDTPIYKVVKNKNINKNILHPAKPEVKKEGSKKNVFIKPSVTEIAAYFKERNNGIDAEAFYAHYESKADASGRWMIGSRPMTNWKMAGITWEKRSKKSGFSSETPPPAPKRLMNFKKLDEVLGNE